MRRIAKGLYEFVRRLTHPGLSEADRAEMDALLAARADRRAGRPVALVWLWAREIVDLVVSGVRGGGARPGRGARGNGAGRLLGDRVRDLSRAARSLRRSPGFAIVAVATLSLAIGATSAVFGIVQAVLLDPLPFEDADELVVIRGSAPGLPDAPEAFDLAQEFYHEFDESPLFTGVSSATLMTSSLRVGEEMERAWMASPSTDMFRTLGVEPVLGRLPDPQDSEEVALLSHSFWTTRFGADPGVIGRSLFAAGRNRTIIGVMGPEFFFPVELAELWIPFDPDIADVEPDVIFNGPTIVARMAPGVDRERLNAELPLLAQRMGDRIGGPAAYARQIDAFRPLIASMETALLGDVRGPLLILLAGVGLVLAIACANVANLFLVRAEDRLRELAVRRALGAGKGRLMSVLFSEAVIIAMLAGIAAVAVVWVVVPLIVAAAPPTVPRLARVAFGPSVIAWVFGASVLCAVACGLIPSWRASEPDLDRLRDELRGTTGRRRWGRDLLVAGQASLALVLLIGSALLFQSFRSLRQVDPGYDVENIFTFNVAPDRADLVDGPSYAAFHLEFADRIEAIPGVEAAGIVENVPLSEGLSSTRIRRVEDAGDPSAGSLISFTFAGGRYFEAMGIDVLEGRPLERGDLELGPKNIVLSLSAADLLFPGERAVGRELVADAGGASLSVVGVVEDILQYDLRDTPVPMAYLPLVGETADTWVIGSPGVVVRTERAEEIEPEIRAALTELSPMAPIYRKGTMAWRAADSMVELSFTLLMLGIVSALALILGAVGLYGVLSYVVSRRTREIGVRMALGAQARSVRRLVVGHGMRVAGVGIVVGLVLAALATRVLQGLLFGVEPADPVTFAAMAAALVVVATLASYVPAWRASRVNPTRSLNG